MPSCLLFFSLQEEGGMYNTTDHMSDLNRPLEVCLLVWCSLFQYSSLTMNFFTTTSHVAMFFELFYVAAVLIWSSLLSSHLRVLSHHSQDKMYIYSAFSQRALSIPSMTFGSELHLFRGKFISSFNMFAETELLFKELLPVLWELTRGT